MLCALAICACNKKTEVAIEPKYSDTISVRLATIDEAKKLIRRGRSFTEIAEALYFDSVPHLSMVFKRYTGMTPGEYKASIK